MMSTMPTTEPLKIAVVGAGAVGCYYGGLLARAGHAVTLIGRAAHVAAMQVHGLRLETQSGDGFVPVIASTDIAAVGDAALVLLCVKSADTERTGQQMAPFLAPAAEIVCLQNGVDNALRLRGVLPKHQVTSAVVYVATEMAGPGHVRHHGCGELLLEAQPAGARKLAGLEALRAAGIPVDVSDNVQGALWFKLILNCAYNAISAITQLPYGQLVPGTGVRELMQDVVAECLLVARADGVVVPGDVDAGIAMIYTGMPNQLSSTAQDLARGKTSEIDYLNGFVVRRGAQLGIATPANRVLWALVKLLEQKAGESVRSPAAQ